MPMAKTGLVRIMHSTDRRHRLHVRGVFRSPQFAARLAAEVREWPEVISARVVVRTGSLILRGPIREDVGKICHRIEEVLLDAIDEALNKAGSETGGEVPDQAFARPFSELVKELQTDLRHGLVEEHARRNRLLGSAISHPTPCSW
ncbi:hypothetical protein GC175_22830 [bacterium]|nr:hypothetical protein [bacterium]